MTDLRSKSAPSPWFADPVRKELIHNARSPAKAFVKKTLAGRRDLTENKLRPPRPENSFKACLRDRNAAVAIDLGPADTRRNPLKTALKQAGIGASSSVFPGEINPMV
jgi:hypothetical protein